MLTRSRRTLVHVDRAAISCERSSLSLFILTLNGPFSFLLLTCESGQARADEASCCFIAESRCAKLRQRLVNQDIRALETLAAVLTGILLTLVYVHLTVVSLVTCTGGTDTSLLTRSTCISFGFYQGVAAFVDSLTGPTLAAVLIYALQTCSSMLTWIRGTFRNIFLTMVTNEPRILTVALVAVTNTNSHMLYLPLGSTRLFSILDYYYSVISHRAMT